MIDDLKILFVLLKCRILGHAWLPQKDNGSCMVDYYICKDCGLKEKTIYKTVFR